MKVAIIGAGAAGLMATATLLESAPHAEIFLIEQNASIGKKVIISGGGRCNVTTGIQDVRTVLTKYPRGNKFLSSAMYSFPPEAVYSWFESHGVPLKNEDDMRVFPQSDDGHDIVGVFEKLFTDSRVQLHLKSSVIEVEKDDEGFIVHIQDKEPLNVDIVVLTTGGQAYRHTGSKGDGYAFAITLGHTITKLAPSLNSFTTLEKWPSELSGLSFLEAKLTADRGNGFTFTGPFLFTHRGISGPAVFALSSLVAFEHYEKNEPLKVGIDLFPNESEDELFKRITSKAKEFSKKNAVNVLAMLVPKSLVHILISELEVSEDKKMSGLPFKEIRTITAWLKNIPLNVIGRGAGDEFVTAGGVELSEINPSTMESKITPGLYFGGEIMNVDAFTGGFNLQGSWAAGRLAGMSIAERLK